MIKLTKSHNENRRCDVYPDLCPLCGRDARRQGGLLQGQAGMGFNANFLVLKTKILMYLSEFIQNYIEFHQAEPIRHGRGWRRGSERGWTAGGGGPVLLQAGGKGIVVVLSLV